MTQKGSPASGWHAGEPWDVVVEEMLHTDGHMFVGASIRHRPHDSPASHAEIGGADGGSAGGDRGGVGGDGGVGGARGGVGGGGGADGIPYER